MLNTSTAECWIVEVAFVFLNMEDVLKQKFFSPLKSARDVSKRIWAYLMDGGGRARLGVQRVDLLDSTVMDRQEARIAEVRLQPEVESSCWTYQCIQLKRATKKSITNWNFTKVKEF